MEDFFDKTLIRLRREYGKDELVAALNKKLSEAEIEIGQLKAEIDFLQNELVLTKEERKITKRARVEIKKEELYKEIVKKNQTLEKKIRSLKQTRDVLVSKCFLLEKNCNCKK